MERKKLACSRCFLSLQVQELLEVNGARAQRLQAAGPQPQPPQAGGSPRSAFAQPARLLRASARRPATQGKARRSSPRATLQHDTANKGTFVIRLGAGTQLLPFKGADHLHERAARPAEHLCLRSVSPALTLSPLRRHLFTFLYPGIPQGCLISELNPG